MKPFIGHPLLHFPLTPSSSISHTAIHLNKKKNHIRQTIRFWVFHVGYWKDKMIKVKSLSRVRLFATPWTVAHQAPPSMGFSKQECWSGLPFPSPRDLPNPGIEPRSPSLQADALPSEPSGKSLLFYGLLTKHSPLWTSWFRGSLSEKMNSMIVGLLLL